MPPVFEWEERWDEREATADVDAGQSIPRSFWVTSDDATLHGNAYIDALSYLAGVYKGAVHPAYPLARCTNIVARVHPDDPVRWGITATYKQPKPDPGAAAVSTPGGEGEDDPQNQSSPEPWNREPFVETDYRRIEYYDTRDKDNKLVENSAGDPYENPPPQLRGIATIKVTRWYETWNDNLGLAYVNKVNSDEWRGKDIDTCLCIGVSQRIKQENAYVFWEIVFTIEWDPLKWIPTKILDQGYNKLVSGGDMTKKTAILDELAKQPLGKPQLLDGTGHVLQDHLSPYYEPYRFYTRISYEDI